MKLPLMPKATAIWLIDNTSLSFDQISEFCGLHELEVQGIADGEVAVGMRGYDPVDNKQLTKEEIVRCESDPKNECFKETCCGQGTRFVNGKCAATYEGLIEACKKDRGRFGFTCEADQSLSCAT